MLFRSGSPWWGAVPHQIIIAEFSASPLQLDAAFQAITYLHRVRGFSSSSDSRLCLPWLALSSSMALSADGHQRCWYSRLSSWFTRLGLDLDWLPPFQYSLDAPPSPFSPFDQEVNRLIRADLLHLVDMVPPRASCEARLLPPTLPRDLT